MTVEIELRPLRRSDDRHELSCGRPDLDRFFKRFGFAPLQGVREGALHGASTPMFLPVATIAAARSEREG